MTEAVRNAPILDRHEEGMIKALFIEFCAMALALGVAILAAPATAATVGDPAPAFTVTTFGGETIALADLAGKVVVLNYWATWCVPCRKEMAMLDAYARNHPDQNLKIFAIATENSVSKTQLQPLSAALSFPLISELNGSGYGAIGRAIPTNYVIDRSGIVRRAAAGAFTDASFQALVAPLLDATPPQAAPTAPTTSAASRP